MKQRLNKLIDKLSEYIAHRKGLIPLIGIGLILLNYFFQFLPVGWIQETDLFLHLGLILALIGFLLSWAL